MEISVKPFNGGNKTKAFVSAKLNVDGGDFYLTGMTLVEGKNGLFLSFPSRKTKDGEYKDISFANKPLREKIQATALEKFGGNSFAGGDEGDPEVPF